METKVSNVLGEIDFWVKNYSVEHGKRMRDWISDLKRKSLDNPGSWIKKIVWDKEGGYPEHAWGYTQYTLRPYRQGYGCDGTTDLNIHLIAMTMAEREGIDYLDIYRRAYPEENGDLAWIADLRSDAVTASETVIPEKNSNVAWRLALEDLHQINNRSLSIELKAELYERIENAQKNDAESKPSRSSGLGM